MEIVIGPLERIVPTDGDLSSQLAHGTHGDLEKGNLTTKSIDVFKSYRRYMRQDSKLMKGGDAIWKLSY
jgi:hypothetical protein